MQAYHLFTCLDPGCENPLILWLWRVRFWKLLGLGPLGQQRWQELPVPIIICTNMSQGLPGLRCH